MKVTAPKPSPTDRELRQFGGILALLLGLYGTFLLIQGSNVGALLLAVAGLLWAAFWAQWPGTRVFYSGWMRAAAAMGQVMTCLLLTGLYLLVLTPLAFLARCCGQRFIDKGFEMTKKSYWRAYRSGADPHGCEKQY